MKNLSDIEGIGLIDLSAITFVRELNESGDFYVEISGTIYSFDGSELRERLIKALTDNETKKRECALDELTALSQEHGMNKNALTILRESCELSAIRKASRTPGRATSVGHIKWTGGNIDEVAEFIGGSKGSGEKVMGENFYRVGDDKLSVRTGEVLEEGRLVIPGDVITKCITLEYGVCSGEAFDEFNLLAEGEE